MPVSTLLFFKALAREHQESAWLRRLKRLLSLLLTLLVIAGSVSALCRLVMAPGAGALRSIVIVMDTSASMAALDGDGRDRLAAAKQRIGARVDGLSAGISVMVMTFDRRPEIVLPFSLDRREIHRALSSIQVRPIEGNPERAVQLAERMAALETPSAIWFASDEDFAVREDDSEATHAAREENAIVTNFNVGLATAKNVGITAFSLRQLPLARGKYEAFVQLHAASEEPVDAKLEVRVDNRLLGLRSMTIEPGGKQKLMIPIDANEGRELSLAAKAEDDVLVSDNHLYARIPELRPIRVLWITEAENPFTQLALTTLGKESDIDVFQAGPSAWPSKEKMDAVIFDGWLPEKWPDQHACVAINPPSSLGPIHAAPLERTGLPVENIRTTGEHHPLLFGLASGRVALTQTSILETGGPLEPLWVGPSGPLLVAGEVRGQRIVVMGFDPESSERLPFTASYPLLMGNALYWAAEPAIEEGNTNYRTGKLVKLEGKQLKWTIPDLHKRLESEITLEGPWTELQRIGLWQTETGESGSASLLSRRETLIVKQESEHSKETDNQTSAWFSGDLSAFMLWCVLLVFVGESYLFHRQGVY